MPNKAKIAALNGGAARARKGDIWRKGMTAFTRGSLSESSAVGGDRLVGCGDRYSQHILPSYASHLLAVNLLDAEPVFATLRYHLRLFATVPLQRRTRSRIARTPRYLLAGCAISPTSGLPISYLSFNTGVRRCCLQSSGLPHLLI